MDWLTLLGILISTLSALTGGTLTLIASKRVGEQIDKFTSDMKETNREVLNDYREFVVKSIDITTGQLARMESNVSQIVGFLASSTETTKNLVEALRQR